MTVTDTAANVSTRSVDEDQRIIVIPANFGVPPYETVAKLTPPHLVDPLCLQGTDTVEFVRTTRLHFLLHTPGQAPRYPSVVMVVDEVGQHRGLRLNNRASQLYVPGAEVAIVGDVYLAGEDQGPDGVDLTALPAQVTLSRVVEACWL